jgi:hypothetical protein
VPRWLRPLPWIRDLYAMTQEVVWHKHFGGRFHDRAHTLAQFAAWNAEVQAVVPPEKLLVYDVRQGWEPLCAFLGVPVPSVPFPHINDRTTTVRRIRLLRTLKHWGPAAAVFGFALLILWWQG